MIDFIVVAIVALCLCGVISYNIRRKKSGESGCSGCSHCSVASCNSRKENEMHS